MSDFKSELALHIRARYPVLWLTSYEEKRIERILGEICEEQKTKKGSEKRLVVWRATTGFTEGDKVTPEAADLGEAFKTVTADAAKGGRTIYLFEDLHKFLPAQDTTVYRAIRDAALKIKEDSFCTIIILAPVMQFPKELEKVVTVIDVPFPSPTELREVMDRAIAGAQMSVKDIKTPENGYAELILRAAAGLTEEEFENICAKSLLQFRAIDAAAIVSEKEAMIRKAGLVDFYEAVDGLQNVGGLENLKEWIIRRSKSFSAKAIAFGLRPPRGIFLAGVTGCGKSLSIKAMANYMKIPMLMVDSSKVLGSYVGQSEQNLRAIFKLARAVAPCILFFDEVEKMMPQNSGGDSGVGSRIFGMLLTEMQECPVSTPVLFAMTANDPLRLPPELFTRFDATVFIDLPTDEEREAIWAVQIRKAKRDPVNFALSVLSGASDGWTGREMEMVVSEALSQAFEQDEELTTAHIQRVLASRQPISVQRKADIDRMRNWGKDTAMPASKVVSTTAGKVRKVEF